MHGCKLIHLYKNNIFFIYLKILNGNSCTTSVFNTEIHKKNREHIMLIVGQVSSKEEASEITFIAKLFVVGQRARYLARQNE